ncbi:response regulator [Crateriforma spongiae]|uniref:response regulator n=1 Tax=Crateriforma spongiae TaxID=2724528 RepID=UPI00144752CE|nr:response regulator [Crateriforma spongiae]
MTDVPLVVLVVEDDEHKFERAKRAINERGVIRANIVRMVTTNEAFQWLKENFCDVMILDLCLPRRKGESPTMDAGPELLEWISRADSRCNIPSRVIGLTAYPEASREFQESFSREGFLLAEYSNEGRDWEEAIVRTLLREISVVRSRTRGVIIPLHGIRTIALWHRTLADVAFKEAWYCSVAGWWYGRFSLFAFLSPLARSAKVRWFRERYTATMQEHKDLLSENMLPSVVAHSFGTFILGNALLKYRDIKVDKVILCGSILPRQFPWEYLVRNGQVSRVLNCVGKEDVWPVVSSFVIPGTGSSGRRGFSVESDSVVQEVHNLSHSEFFDPMQIKSEWFGFLEEPVFSQASERAAGHIPRAKADHPFITAAVSPLVFLLLLFSCLSCAYLVSWGYVKVVDVAIESLWHLLGMDLTRR